MKKSIKTLGYAIIFALLDMFPVSLYGRNLSERLTSLWYSLRSSVPTLLNILTVMILIITITVVAGLYVGSTQWLEKYIENDRMARTVEVSALFGTQVEFFTDQHIEQLRQISIEENVAPIEAAFGWNDLTLWFYTADGSIDTGLTHGRSVNVADPVLKRMTFQKKPNTFFSDKGIAQIIVSQSLLESLNYDEIPSHLTIEYLNASAQVEVVGVADWTPAGDFLMTDDFNRAINDRTWNPNPRYDLAYVGPILDTTTANAQLKSIRKRLSRLKIKGQIIKRFGSEEWFEFRKPKKAAWNQQQWEELFISTIKPKFGERHEFHDPLAPEISSFDKINVGYIRASIYVKSLSDVPTVVDTLVDKGYKVTNDVKQLAQIFMQVSSFGGGILKWVVFIVGTLSVISIGLSITQTIQGKTPEIGILKAYGASNYLIFFIYMLEALLIWLLALVGGSFFIYQVADFVNESMIRIFTLQGAIDMSNNVHIVDIPVELFIGIGLGSFGLVALATFFASLTAINLQPARALAVQR
jgi:cell division protein FtsX